MKVKLNTNQLYSSLDILSFIHLLLYAFMSLSDLDMWRMEIS